jgi:L-aminopeptidase/D-esterase-like protein
VPAGWFSFNGNGEMTGTTWIEESGYFEGPILLTNTTSVGTVRDAVIKWTAKQYQARGRFDPNDFSLSLPVVAETWDGFLNDGFGFHVRQADVEAALESASQGPVEQGNVGGGTGMTCYEFKGGIGTSSRRVSKLGAPVTAGRDPASAADYVVGVLVQANHGKRPDLLVRGVPVGRELPLSEIPRVDPPRKSSIIVIVATNAPLMPHQLKRMARRATLGLARTGTIGSNSSGDIFLAFSTANSRPSHGGRAALPAPPLAAILNEQMDPLFEATTEATEEAIINALVAAETMTGRDNHTAFAIPHARLQEIMRKYNRLGPC